jgi:hypothetical protein
MTVIEARDLIESILVRILAQRGLEKIRVRDYMRFLDSDI